MGEEFEMTSIPLPPVGRWRAGPWWFTIAVCTALGIGLANSHSPGADEIAGYFVAVVVIMLGISLAVWLLWCFTHALDRIATRILR